VLPGFLRWSRLGLRAKGLIVVGLALLPLAVFWAFVAFAVFRLPQPSNIETRSLIVQASLARVFSDLLDADAGARNHLLTNSQRAYRRYETAVTRLPAELAILDNAVIDPEQRGTLTILREVVADEIAVLARLAGDEPPAGFARIGEVAALDRSAANLDRLRTLTLAMERRQATLAEAQSLKD
jgi:CHASE3 domain sensor protein